MSKQRYHSLDSLRGIASLQVLIAHSLVAVPFLTGVVYGSATNQPFDIIILLIHSPISFLWSDSAAVKVFFVLSGFVLSLPYYTIGKSNPYYPAFFIKRIVRLYLPCLAVILLSLLCRSLLYTPNILTNFGAWVQMMWTLPINSAVVIKLLLLNDHLDYIDRALWTLPPEIKLSLILPLIIYVLKRTNKFWTIATVFMYVVVWHGLNKLGARNVWPDYPVLYFFTFFILGSVVCKYRLSITNWINVLPAYRYFLFVVLMLVTYTFKSSFYWLPARFENILNGFTDYVTAMSAMMLLAIVLSRRAQALLNSKVLLFLGKISFSLYLIHIIVISVFAYLLHAYFSPLITVALAFLSCFPLAVLFYKLVEVPSLNFANYCSKKIVEHHYSKKLFAYISKKTGYSNTSQNAN